MGPICCPFEYLLGGKNNSPQKASTGQEVNHTIACWNAPTRVTCLKYGLPETLLNYAVVHSVKKKLSHMRPLCWSNIGLVSSKNSSADNAQYPYWQYHCPALNKPFS